MGCVYVCVTVLTFLGPEYLGRNFDVAADEDMAAVTVGDRKIRSGSVAEQHHNRGLGA